MHPLLSAILEKYQIKTFSLSKHGDFGFTFLTFPEAPMEMQAEVQRVLPSILDIKFAVLPEPDKKFIRIGTATEDIRAGDSVEILPEKGLVRKERQ